MGMDQLMGGAAGSMLGEGGATYGSGSAAGVMSNQAAMQSIMQELNSPGPSMWKQILLAQLGVQARNPQQDAIRKLQGIQEAQNLQLHDYAMRLAGGKPEAALAPKTETQRMQVGEDAPTSGQYDPTQDRYVPEMANIQTQYFEPWQHFVANRLLGINLPYRDPMAAQREAETMRSHRAVEGERTEARKGREFYEGQLLSEQQQSLAERVRKDKEAEADRDQELNRRKQASIMSLQQHLVSQGFDPGEVDVTPFVSKEGDVDLGGFWKSLKGKKPWKQVEAEKMHSTRAEVARGRLKLAQETAKKALKGKSKALMLFNAAARQYTMELNAWEKDMANIGKTPPDPPRVEDYLNAYGEKEDAEKMPTGDNKPAGGPPVASGESVSSKAVDEILGLKPGRTSD
jgi:hypothetical protein